MMVCSSHTPSLPWNQLNKTYKDDHNAICNLHINGTGYVVDFKFMKQVNLKTGYKRDVTKDPCEAASGVVRWKYRDDLKCFASYSPSDSAQIEAMFQANNTSCHLVILNRRYTFDFARLKQVNMATGYERDIKREFPGSDKEVARASRTFLYQNEVVVNFKGPSKFVQLAKGKLHDKLKSLLFSKTTPYPPKATPALLAKLKEISCKHLVTCTVENSNESDVGKCVKLEGLESAVGKANSEIQDLIIKFTISLDQLPKSSADNTPQYPREWDVMTADDQVKLVPLNVHSSEYIQVWSKFQKTFDKQILGVQRVQNKWLWDRYMTAKQRLHKKNAGMVNEKELFHGTRDKPAETICRSEEGFDMRFSRQGMWGQANYFAVNASYSDSYSYHDSSSETNEMILAKVLTGDSYYCRQDSTLRMPPEKKQAPSGDAQVQQVRYDSVTGDTHGSQVFMTYSNDLAYPAYIITYTRKHVAHQPPSVFMSAYNPPSTQPPPPGPTHQPSPPGPSSPPAPRATYQPSYQPSPPGPTYQPSPPGPTYQPSPPGPSYQPSSSQGPLISRHLLGPAHLQLPGPLISHPTSRHLLGPAHLQLPGPLISHPTSHHLLGPPGLILPSVFPSPQLNSWSPLLRK